MSRLQRLLAALLGLQLVLAAVVFWPRAAAETPTGPLFPDLTVDAITGLTLTSDTGQTVTLARRGDAWVLADGGDYPANAATITPLLERIVALQANRLVASAGTSRRQLQVAEDGFLRRVVLTRADGSSDTLYVGSSPSPRATHVRRADQDAIYLISDLNIFELNPAATNWIDPVYVTLDRDAVTQFTIENAQGTTTFVKAADSTWGLADLAEGETLDESAFSLLFNRVITLRLTRPLGTTDNPAYGLGDPQATATVTTTDGVFDLRVGAQVEESGNYVVKWSGSDYFVEVAQFNVADLVNNGRDAFLLPPPTPEATPTP